MDRSRAVMLVLVVLALSLGLAVWSACEEMTGGSSGSSSRSGNESCQWVVNVLYTQCEFALDYFPGAPGPDTASLTDAYTLCTIKTGPWPCITSCVDENYTSGAADQCEATRACVADECHALAEDAGDDTSSDDSADDTAGDDDSAIPAKRA